jgi:hypothetical protein
MAFHCDADVQPSSLTSQTHETFKAPAEDVFRHFNKFEVESERKETQSHYQHNDTDEEIPSASNKSKDVSIGARLLQDYNEKRNE